MEIKINDSMKLVIDTVQFLRELDIAETYKEVQDGTTNLTLVDLIDLALEKAVNHHESLNRLLVKASNIESIEELESLSGDEYLDLVEAFFDTALFRRALKRLSRRK